MLDSSCAVNANTWCETLATDIQSMIDAALSVDYPQVGGGTTKNPGGYANYKIADVETGGEIWTNDGDVDNNGTYENKGTLVGAFSRSRLLY